MKKIIIFIGILFISVSGKAQLLTENFDTALNWTSARMSGASSLPGWSRVTAGTNPTCAPSSGAGMARFNSYNVPAGDSFRLTSPAITFSGASYKVKFKMFRDSGDGSADKIDVYFNTTATTVGGTLLGTVNRYTASDPAESADGWYSYSFDLPTGISGTGYISFLATSDYGNNIFIDSVSVSELVSNDIGLAWASLNRYSFPNDANTIEMNVYNQGSNTINNVTINWNDGVDHSSDVSVSIPARSSLTITHPVDVSYSTIVGKNILISITAVNGVANPSPADGFLYKRFNTISQTVPRKVIFEEGTGTWCGWCPRGAVAMDYMHTTYPNDFIGVAVHNGDGMTVVEYNSGAAFSGYPGMNVDRSVKGIGISPGTMESYMNDRKNLINPASVSATANLSGSNITILANAVFRTSSTIENYRFGVIITEDNVTGFSQTNYYSGGANGVMGGYETKANPVPASEMVYNHVGRVLLGGFNGQAGSIPTTIVDGQPVNYTFNYTIPSTINLAKINAIIVIIDEVSGEIVNSNKIVITTLGTNQNNFSNNNISLLPNPASDNFNINGLMAGNYNIRIFDISGKELKTFLNKDIQDNEKISLPINEFSKGIYLVNIATEGKSFTKQLIVK
jgi:Secretion system C-terminal sorting domain/Outer membrane protein Omp28